mgnify:CR=1 FL=1
MKTEILKLLRESGDYISGQELCSLFGVSRTAVWKVINQLKEEGYGIEAVQPQLLYWLLRLHWFLLWAERGEREIVNPE